MPAPASLSIPDLVEQLGGVELPNPITVAPELEAALGPLAALQGYTSTAAWAAGEADAAGRIAVGARADLTAFTVDPLRAAPDELADAPVALTVVDGAVVHRAALVDR